MPVHNVFVDLPEREIGNSDVIFVIQEDGKKLGTITISKGGIEYFPANTQIPLKLNWTRFDNIMKEYR
jgi:hypothetical protein